MRDGRESTTGSEAPQAHQSLPIVALDSSGVIVKANAPARKVLAGAGVTPEHQGIGSVLAGLLAPGTGRASATLRLSRNVDEAQDILVVLSESSSPLDAAVDEGPPSGEPAAPSVSRPDGSVADYIAHELRNPLSAILGISQVLEERSASVSQSERQEALETIHSEADRALQILQSLLRLAESRSHDGLELKSIPLHSLVRSVVATHSRRNPHRFLTISGDSPLFATANSIWVELALSNLLTNAEKYTPRDRRIEVAFHQVGSWATILVFDNGAGLRPDLYRTLWDIYSRGPEDGVHVGGSGIGLALCKELIEGMGGHVWAGPGRAGGSVFAVSLPSSCDMTVPSPLPQYQEPEPEISVLAERVTQWS